MQADRITPRALALRVLVYFVVVVAVLAMLASFVPRSQEFLPFGGSAVDVQGTAQQVFSIGSSANTEADEPAPAAPGPWTTRFDAAVFLVASLLGTIVLMIPITWVYMAIKTPQGYPKAFVEALIVLPICATTVVLLIQDSLALAFGLAALVAAVRFRVRLRDALDGIYVFAAICVGLASGIGYLGVALVMTVFFCFASIVLWGIDYGANPVETAKQAKKLAELGEADPGAQAR
ncbi:MAG TPA: DUF4956 domain-containing protein [Gammaproteobacteria bacterium]|nr:DUF4956 domain-containing protein [Gammaproteobacteria bacterium]